jgi:hypothetical protein
MAGARIDALTNPVAADAMRRAADRNGDDGIAYRQERADAATAVPEADRTRRPAP